MERTITNGLYADLGGYVFYVTPNGKRGLVAATQDQSASSTWYDAQNMISDPANHNAAGENFTDWRMPTKYELNLMYSEKEAIGLFADEYYWNSTQSSEIYAGIQDFTNGDQGNNNGAFVGRVRAVRAFDISAGDIANLGNQTGTNATETGSGTTASPDLENEATSSPTYTIGVNKDLGGYVFFVAPDGKSGLVAATQDQGGRNDWYSVKDGINKPENHNADGQKFADWRMPTLQELTLMYNAREDIGGFENGVRTKNDYWSSTEFVGNSPSPNAFALRFSDGFGFHSNMSFMKCYARAVRAI